MAKRFLSLLCAVVMLIGMIPVGVHAAETTGATPVFSVEETWATTGKTVEVKVTVSNNPGILGGTLVLSWAEELELISAKNGDAFEELNYQKPSRFVHTGTNFVWYGDSVSEVMDGTVLTLTFKVPENLDNAKKLYVNLSGNSIIDTNKNRIEAIFVSGGIQVINYIPGDVDGDGLVDPLDLIALAQFISDGCITDPDGYNVTLNESAADVNDDGTMDPLDLISIAQYVSDGCVTDPDGYNVVLKPATPKCSHGNMEEIAYKAATCTEDGYVQHFYCDDCGKYFNDNVGTVELTWEQIVLVSEGHNEVIDEAVAPTYTSTGLTEGSHCSVCGVVFVEQEEVPMLQANHHSITYRNLNGAETPEPSSYAEHLGLDELPTPVAPGYTFKGWYTASEGGTVVDYIPAGSTQDYILYARWELITYTITYFEAPNYEGAATYTVEDEIYLAEPNWPGLGFTGWTDPEGKIITEVSEAGTTLYKIEPGTTGNLKLTANWKLMRNIATPGTNRKMLAEYNAETNRYTFIYELGTIENVVLEQMSSNLLYNHTGAGDFTLEMSQENTLEESIADSITRTISKSVSSSTEWESSKDWAKENSTEHSTEESIGAEIGSEANYFKAIISAGYGYSHSSTSSWGGSETQGGSYGEETENGEEVGSCFSYLTSLTTSSMTSVTISADAPQGYYDYVQVGNIRVFGVVTYMPSEVEGEEGTYYLNTYSMLDNMHGVVLYYPDVNALNNPTCETLQYNIPRENIQEVIENSYFVQYDANGGQGEMNVTLHTVGGTEKLAKNTFTKEGYQFIGWETREKVEGQDDPVSTGTYTDEQIINTALAANGVTVTMYALWTKNDYTIEYEGNKPALGSTYVDYLPDPAGCKFDEDVTLAAAPTLPGYTFGGWYFDSLCSQKAGDAGEILEKANLTSEPGGTVKLYAKWTPNTYKLIFDTNGGTLEKTEVDVVFDTQFSIEEVPTREDHDFLGWYLSDGSKVDGTSYWRTAGDVVVTAKWLKTRQVLEFRMGYKAANKKTDLVTDNDEVFDWIAPGMDRVTLVEQGYSKLSVKVHIWLYEQNDGNKDFWIMPYYDAEDGKSVEHVRFTSTKGQWNEHKFSFELIDISSSAFNDFCEFWMEYGAEGNQGDDWYLGDTWITIEAVK